MSAYLFDLELFVHHALLDVIRSRGIANESKKIKLENICRGIGNHH